MRVFLTFGHQLKSFVHLRINLSPFTKDFRVRETPIENSNYFSSFPRGSIYGSKTLLTDSTFVLAAGKHHQTFPNESVHQIIDNIAQKQKWKTLLKDAEPTHLLTYTKFCTLA